MVFLSRLIAALAYAGAAFLFCVLLGERGELGLVQGVFTAVIPLTTLVLAVVSRRGKVQVVATGLAMLAGLLLGQRQFDRAWADCLVRGEEVRQSLLRHERETSGFPSHLEDLEGELPCRCGLRRTILHYLSNDRGFRLWYTNDAVTHVATDRTAFTASGRSSSPRRR